MAAQKLIVSLLGFGLTLLARSAAAQAILDVAPPSGKDDTTNIQAALDACAAQGPSCTVQLQAGKAFVPSSPSRYFIHDNKFFATGQFAEGFYFFNEPTNPWIDAAAWNNTVELQDTLSEGIGAYNTKSTAIWNNTVTGTDGFDAIGLHGSTFSRVISNNVSGFTVGPTGFAQLYLDPSTAHDLVVCADSGDTILNQGTNNIVVGCQQPMASPEGTTKSVVPAASTPRPSLPKGKPWLH